MSEDGMVPKDQSSAGEHETQACRKVLVTPELAKEMLGANSNNRVLNANRVATIAWDIRNGNWSCNGETIKVRGDGVLQDGQHRLQAIAASGVPCWSWVLYGADQEAMRTIDTGGARTKSNVLQLAGKHNTIALAAGAGFAICYLSGAATWSSLPANYTTSRIVSFIAENPRIEHSVSVVVKTDKLRRMLGARVGPGCHFLFARKDPADADRFYSILRDGSGLDQDDPIYLLREKLAENAGSRKYHFGTVAGLTIRAWNHFRKGTRIKVLPVCADLYEKLPEVQ